MAGEIALRGESALVDDAILNAEQVGVSDFLAAMHLVGRTESGNEIRAAAIIPRGLDVHGEESEELFFDPINRWRKVAPGMVGSLLVARVISANEHFTVDASLHTPGGCTSQRIPGCRLIFTYSPRIMPRPTPRRVWPQVLHHQMLSIPGDPVNALEQVVTAHQIEDVGPVPLARAIVGLQQTHHRLTPLVHEFDLEKVFTRTALASAEVIPEIEAQ